MNTPLKNNPSFWTWSGNELKWFDGTKYIVYGFIFLALALMFVFKKQIRLRNNNNTERAFFGLLKNDDVFWQIIGFALLVFQFVKLTLYILGGYPLYWEHLFLHICRIHMLAITLFLIFKKQEWMKYITYISTMGALLAIGFGSMDANYLKPESNKYFLFVKHGFVVKDELTGALSGYSVGPDNLFYYDFFFLHMFIILVPIYLWTKNSWEFPPIKAYRGLFLYIVVYVALWSYNSISVIATDKREWWANNWYVGPAQSNDYPEALGWLTMWPQNLFCVFMLTFMFCIVSHLIFIFQSYYEFNGWKVVKTNSTQWKIFKDGHYKYSKKFWYALINWKVIID